MGLFKEVELIIPHNKTITIKPFNGHDAIRMEIDEGNTLSVNL